MKHFIPNICPKASLCACRHVQTACLTLLCAPFNASLEYLISDSLHHHISLSNDTETVQL